MPDGLPRWGVVMFDFDDTLYDSQTSLAAAYDAAARAAGISEPSVHRPTFERINTAMWRQVEQGAMAPDDVKVRRFAAFCDEVGVDADPVELAETFVDTLITVGDLLPGAHDLLDALSGRARIGLVTNGIGRVQRGRLERLGCVDVFDVIVISGEVGVAKPDPSIFDLAFGDLDPDTSTRPRLRADAVMVGDSLTSDVAGAHAASIASIWFDRDGRGRAPTDVVPTHRTSSLDGVRELLLSAS